MLCIKNINFFFMRLSLCLRQPRPPRPHFQSFCRLFPLHSAVAFWTTPGGPSFCRGLTHGLYWRFWTSPCPLLEEGVPGCPIQYVDCSCPCRPVFPWGTDCSGPNYSWEGRCCPESPIFQARSGSRPCPFLPPRTPAFPEKTPGHGPIPLLQEGCPKGGVVHPSRLRREPLPAYISSLIARTSPSVSSAIFATVAGSRPSASMLRTSRRVFSSRPCSRPTSRSHIIDSRTSS